jgi:beta-galactosidase
VTVKGGNDYGQCLQSGWAFIPKSKGYTRIEASLLKGKTELVKGDDLLFAVELDTKGITTRGSVADTTGALVNFLRGVGMEVPVYKGGTPEGDYLLVGAYKPQQWGSGISDIMEWVYKGHTLIIVDNPEEWANFLSDKEVLDYRGSKVLGKAWYGGNFFNRCHRLFDGLPSDCVFNWEYQCFATYDRRRIGLRCINGDILVGCVSDHRKEVYSALTVIPAGRGKIILTTLDIPACIRGVKPYSKEVDLDGMNESMNTFDASSDNKANIVGQQLLLNFLKEVYRW